MNKTTLTLIALTLLGQANAEEKKPKSKEHLKEAHHDSLTHIEVLTVHGQKASNEWSEAVESIGVLEGDDLAKTAQTTLGETLAKEIGITSTQFGPNASRPVIRGLDGNRIRLLQDGMGIMGLSGASQDHAVPINPLTAERVEVVRGPLNLLYGSSAIGGVVNVVTSKIHRNYHEHSLGAVDVKTNSSNNAQNTAMNVDYGANDFMLHIDADMGQGDEMNAPDRKITNSEFRQKSYSVGTSYFIAPETYVGVAYSKYDNLYGTVAEEGVDIDMDQERVDLMAHHKLNGFFTGIQLKSSQTFYEHQELEDGAVATEFDNDTNETRLELFHKISPKLNGLFGIQTLHTDFKAVGEEAFLPHNKTAQYALFGFEQYKSGNWKVNFGARFEHTKIDADAGNILASAQEKDFNTVSVATGALYNITNSLSTGLNLSYNERAATYQELFAGGNHVAIGINENGDSNIGKEKSIAAEWSLRNRNDWSEGVFNLFGHKFTNYIALNPTGNLADAEPGEEAFEIYNYEQTEALLYGAELSFTHFVGNGLQWTVKGDYLRGRDTKQHRNLARMTPLRLTGELRYNRDLFSTGLNVQRVFEQNSTATSETSTPAYTVVNFEVSNEFNLSENSMLLYAQLNNLTDEVAINHVSMIKDKMRMAKRHIVVGVRASF